MFIMKISKGLRNKLNKIAQKYSKWLYPKEIAGFYDEVAELGVYIPAWSKWDDQNAHPYFIDGEDVIMYESMEDAFAKAEYYLREAAQLERIANNGHTKVKEYFDYPSRIGELLNNL